MAQPPRVHSHLARYLYNTSSWPPPLPSITKESSPITINQLAPSSSKPTNQESPTSVQRSSATTDDEDDSVMGNNLRCCLACMVPCGALDVVRVVHLRGRVDEFSCPVAAAAVLAANPSHTLTTAWSPSGAPGCGSRKLAIVSPDADLKRGRIYFLIPSATLPAERRGKTKQSSSSKRPSQSQSSRRHRHHAKKQSAGGTAEQDNYLRELLSEKHASSGAHRRRRSGARVGVWRPRLESIVEEASD